MKYILLIVSFNIYGQWSGQTYDYRTPILRFLNDIRNAYQEKSNKYIIRKEENTILFFEEDSENGLRLDSTLSITHTRSGKWDSYIFYTSKYLNFNGEDFASNSYVVLKTQLNEPLLIKNLLEFKFPKPQNGEKVWIYYDREKFNVYWSKESNREYLGFEFYGNQIAIEEISKKNYSRIFNRYSCGFDTCSYNDLISESRKILGFWLESFTSTSRTQNFQESKEISQIEANAILQGPYEFILNQEFKKLQEQLQPFSVDGPITFFID